MSDATTVKPIDRIRSRREFAELLGVSIRTLARLEDRGRLPSRVQISDRRFGYRESDIRAFIEAA